MQLQRSTNATPTTLSVTADPALATNIYHITVITVITAATTIFNKTSTISTTVTNRSITTSASATTRTLPTATGNSTYVAFTTSIALSNITGKYGKDTVNCDMKEKLLH